MSIINDAIKKARRESGISNKNIPGAIVREEKGPKSSEIKWTAIIVASLVLIVSLLGSVVLYKHMSKLNTLSSPSTTEGKNPFFKNAYRKTELSTLELKNIVKLNGIVYGPEDRWAIINNEIARVGDTLLGGKLTLIAKDFVRIENSNGEKIVLTLR